MAARRNLLDRIFGRRPNEDQKTVRLEVVAGYGSVFSQWGGDPYTRQVVREAIDAIARNAAKLKPRHVRRIEGAVVAGSGQLDRLLAVRPNRNMSAYDLMYKAVTTLQVDNNAFLYPEWDRGTLAAIWPVSCTHAEFLADELGAVYVRFWLRDGKPKVLPYAEVIHIRRHFYESELAGEDNAPLNDALEVIRITNEGIAKAVQTSAHLRGLLKFTAMLKPEDIKKQRDDFVADYLSVDNEGGIAALDSKAEYTELKTDPKVINALQMQELRNSVYRYFGVSEAIVASKYSEDEWAAFYESVIEPIAVQLSLEFTAKLFTERERGHGNEIVFEANRLQYASVKTKLDLREMVDRGALLPNEWREAFNLGPIEGGDKPLRRLDTGVVSPSGQIGNEGGSDDGGDGQEGNSPSGTTGE